MKNNYQLFKDWETEKSHLLAEGLKIKAEEHIAIEKCFDFLLESHKDFNTFDDQMNELPHADEKEIYWRPHYKICLTTCLHFHK